MPADAGDSATAAQRRQRRLAEEERNLQRHAAHRALALVNRQLARVPFQSLAWTLLWLGPLVVGLLLIAPQGARQAPPVRSHPLTAWVGSLSQDTRQAACWGIVAACALNAVLDAAAVAGWLPAGRWLNCIPFCCGAWRAAERSAAFTRAAAESHANSPVDQADEATRVADRRLAENLADGWRRQATLRTAWGRSLLAAAVGWLTILFACLLAAGLLTPWRWSLEG